ncbi:hypothetical protein WKH31_16465 [Metabacillus indicus]|uniref:hypothetical protein n=1 Tax=Metabacillus indicus TaxID=246786 RepID=UPI00317E440A
MKVVPVETVRNAVQLQEELNNVISDDCKEEVYDFKSGKIVHVKPRLADKVKAIESLEKFGGHFVQKIEVVPTTITVDIIEEDNEYDRKVIDADFIKL